ncbi:MAG: hypothetical protein UMU75_08570 [Halomonas sp.]|nr:hypothetical protein [Halomonas sp.]
MNSFTTPLYGKLVIEMQIIAERLCGSATLIDALAECENANLGLEMEEAYAVKVVSRRLKAYADIWWAGAKHITTPSLPVEDTGLKPETIRHARAWMAAPEDQRIEIGELFECYAEYLYPCIQAFRPIEHRYSDSRTGTDEARTFNALYFIYDELESLASDIAPLVQEVWDAWSNLPKQGGRQ